MGLLKQYLNAKTNYIHFIYLSKILLTQGGFPMRKVVLLTVALISIWAVIAYSAPGDTLWTRTYGGTLGDIAYSVAQTEEGGFILAGYTSSFGAGELDCYIIITDDTGYVIWDSTYGGLYDDYANSAYQTTDNGYIIGGCSDTSGPTGLELYLIKTDSTHDTTWTLIYGHSGVHDTAIEVQQFQDSLYYVIGGSKGDFLLMVVDLLGDTLWTRFYGDPVLYEGPTSGQQTSDKGYVIAGYRNPDQMLPDAYIVKIDSIGVLEWERQIGGTDIDYANSILQLSEGGYIVAGTTRSWGEGNSDVWLLKIDVYGDTQWTRTYGKSGSEMAFSIIEVPEGGYIIAGSTTSYGNNDQFYVIRIDDAGDTIWTRNYGGVGEEIARDMIQVDFGRYVITGNTSSFGEGERDVWLVAIKDGFIIDSIYHSPITPYPNQDCEVSAIIKNEIYVENALLCYNVNSGSYSCLQMNNIADSFYATIPGQAEYDTVCYYIVAWDDLGDTTYSNTTCYEVLPMPCLLCDTYTTTPLVPNIEGTIIWSMDVANCGVQVIPVYAEIYPTVGDCASGTQYDFNINRLAVSNLGAGDSTTVDYWYRPGIVTGVTNASINIDIGPLINYYVGNCCFEFRFAYEFGRPGTIINFGPGKWGERENEVVIPSIMALMQNHPNPFNATTTISFDIVQSDDVNISVYNLAGQKIETLIDNKMNAGSHQISWDASTYSSGVYFYKLTTNGKAFTKRMTLLK